MCIATGLVVVGISGCSIEDAFEVGAGIKHSLKRAVEALKHETAAIDPKLGEAIAQLYKTLLDEKILGSANFDKLDTLHDSLLRNLDQFADIVGSGFHPSMLSDPGPAYCSSDVLQRCISTASHSTYPELSQASR